MALDGASADEAFRAEVRAFFDEALTPNIRAEAARQTGVFAAGPLARRWQRILFERGWIAPAWPEEYGGTGWSPRQRHIFAEEAARAEAPSLPAMGLQMCGPVLIGYGTPEQKAFFLPRILSGEHYWCQGYSEPQSGSDLASLQTRAVRDGDDYVVNGSKIWTTHAQYANWMFLLVRTSTEGRPQSGITFLLTPMDTPGLSVRPIISMSGEHEINQCFFDEVRIPVANRVGDENRGWAVAKYLLEFERGAGSAAGRLRRLTERAKALAMRAENGSGSLWADSPDFRRRLHELEMKIEGHDFSEQRAADALSRGDGIGDSTASRLKLTSSELTQTATELAMEALGVFAAPDQRASIEGVSNQAPVGGDWALTPTARYLNGRANTIFGGTSEVQRNILARVVLGV